MAQRKELRGWREDEDIALMQFVISEGYEAVWPATKKVQLWEHAAKFVKQKCERSRTSI